MSKYSFEFKLKVVKEYMGEEGLERKSSKTFTLENLSFVYYNIGNTTIALTERKRYFKSHEKWKRRTNWIKRRKWIFESEPGIWKS